MARFAPPPFNKDQVPGAPEWTNPLFQQLGNLGDLLQRVLQGGLSFKDNFAADVRDIVFTAPEEQWIAPTLGNSWVNFGSGTESAGYAIRTGGKVDIKGNLKSGTPGASSVPFTLPTGFRPAETIFLATASNSAYGTLQVKSTGEVVCVSGSTTSFSIHCSFQASSICAFPQVPVFQSGIPTVAHDLKDVTGVIPMSLRALDVTQDIGMGAPVIEWEKSGSAQIKIRAIWGLQPGRRYSMRLLLVSE